MSARHQRQPCLLVTGASGLVMSHLVRRWLESDPQARAIALDLDPPDGVVKAFFEPVAERLAFHRGDVGGAGLWRGLEGADAITHMVHGAAVTSIERLTRLPDGGRDMTGAVGALETNIIGTARALAWAGRQKELVRMITVSSGSVYDGDGPEPLPEDGYVAPEGLYPLTKYMGELLTDEAARSFGLPACSVRLSGVYGPLDRETGTRAVKSVPFTLLRRALDGEEVRVAGLEAVGDYIHAGDVADALRALLACPAPRHRVYNIALGETWSLGELLRLVEAQVPGMRWRETPAGEADLALDPALTGGRWGAYDISRLSADTGWHPRPLADAFVDYGAWLRRHPY
jgi:UDP-glucose 4-epimerase